MSFAFIKPVALLFNTFGKECDFETTETTVAFRIGDHTVSKEVELGLTDRQRARKLGDMAQAMFERIGLTAVYARQMAAMPLIAQRLTKNQRRDPQACLSQVELITLVARRYGIKPTEVRLIFEHNVKYPNLVACVLLWHNKKIKPRGYFGTSQAAMFDTLFHALDI